MPDLICLLVFGMSYQMFKRMNLHRNRAKCVATGIIKIFLNSTKITLKLYFTWVDTPYS